MPAATIAAAIWPAPASPRAWARLAAAGRAAALIIAGAALLSLSSQLGGGFPIPTALQGFAALTLAAAYGARLGGATVALHLIAGAAGVPALGPAPEASGLGALAGPLGGFLAGLFAGAIATGWLVERGFDRSPAKLAAALAAGHALLLGLGFLWLAAHVGSSLAWTVGVSPLVAAGAYQALIGALILQAGWTILGRRGRLS